VHFERDVLSSVAGTSLHLGSISVGLLYVMDRFGNGITPALYRLEAHETGSAAAFGEQGVVEQTDCPFLHFLRRKVTPLSERTSSMWRCTGTRMRNPIRLNPDEGLRSPLVSASNKMGMLKPLLSQYSFLCMRRVGYDPEIWSPFICPSSVPALSLASFVARES
jgi:hypothetical protein